MDRKKTWERRVSECKLKHRPKLKNWSRDEFASKRRSDFIELRHNLSKNVDTLQKVNYAKVSCDEFIQKYEKPNIPCVIMDVPAVDNWKASKDWIDYKLFAKRFKNELFKVGEDDDGYRVRMKYKYFIKYMQHNEDDSPLYIFDGNLEQNEIRKQILQDYQVPKYFRDDLFHLAGEDRRPPYRWFLVGPSRSGSTVHIDPLGTSAWNTLLQGRKRWVLFPPNTSKTIAKGLDVIEKGEDNEAINYFIDLLPRIKSKYFSSSPSPSHGNIIEFIQQAGETVFVPSGWWHGVLNLEDTVAVTQNFCSVTNFEKVWKKTRSQRKKMAVSWLKRLKTFHPMLYNQAMAFNQEDNFQMYQSDRKKKGIAEGQDMHKDSKKRKFSELKS